jgi:hypothetical protein
MGRGGKRNSTRQSHYLLVVLNLAHSVGAVGGSVGVRRGGVRLELARLELSHAVAAVGGSVGLRRSGLRRELARLELAWW